MGVASKDIPVAEAPSSLYLPAVPLQQTFYQTNTPPQFEGTFQPDYSTVALEPHQQLQMQQSSNFSYSSTNSSTNSNNSSTNS